MIALKNPHNCAITDSFQKLEKGKFKMNLNLSVCC